VSTDTGALDRSSLDGKDKAELATIASAMGGKPTSRTRKGDMIDMILELAGVTESKKSSNNGSKKSKKSSDDADAGSSKGAGSDSSDDSGSDDSGSDDSGYGFSADPFDDARAEGASRARRRAGETDDHKDDDRTEDAAGEDADSNDADAKDGGHRNDDDAKDGRGASSRGESRHSGDRKDDHRDGDRKDGGRNRDKNRDAGKDRNRDKNRDGKDSNRDSRSSRNRDGSNRDSRSSRNRDGSSRDGRGRNNDRNNDRNSNRSKNNDPQPEAGNRKRRRRGRGGGSEPDQDVVQWDGEPIPVEGYLDLRPDGYGFLRVKGALPSDSDVYVPTKVARELGLRRGDHLVATSRPANRNEKNPALLELGSVNGLDPAAAKARPRFDDLTPLFPDSKLVLERLDDPTNMTCRIIDLISPIGKGQRGLIVSPPKAGKTTIMKEIARSIEINSPDTKVLVLLVDERPEEVTDMKRWLMRDSSEVIASTFDKPSDQHTAVAEMTIERAKRMVEVGDDVVIILDGITRLARAYNLAAPSTGRIMSGGVDSGALYPPKRFFGAARNIEEGGSLTILATALVQTGSKMDEVIFEEFKGTGNMELRLDRKTAERRVYPAIDVDASSTRHEELLFDRTQLNQVWKLRRVLSGMANDEDNGRGNAAGLELLIDRLKTFSNNDEFLAEVARGPVG